MVDLLVSGEESAIVTFRGGKIVRLMVRISQNKIVSCRIGIAEAEFALPELMIQRRMK
jgi:hypothetical protein